MKANRKSIVCLLLSLAYAAPSFPQILNVPQKYQQKSQWCWAATSQAVLAYYGIHETQQEIAQYGTLGENIWNWLYGQTSNPLRRGVDKILQHFGSIASQGYSDTFTYDTLIALLGENKAVPLRWKWDSGGGHILVLHGAKEGTVYLMDPLYGPTIQSYNWLLRGGGHTWTHTLKLLSIPTMVSDEASQPPTCFRLLQNYPNPFNESTCIRFELDESSHVTLLIFDILGREVVQLISGNKPAGSHSIIWRAQNMPSGIYLVKLQAGSKVATQKVIVQK